MVVADTKKRILNIHDATMHIANTTHLLPHLRKYLFPRQIIKSDMIEYVTGLNMTYQYTIDYAVLRTNLRSGIFSRIQDATMSAYS